MFTGIIEERGTVRCLRRLQGGVRMQIEAQKVLPDLKPDDSVAVNGVCLTVEKLSKNGFEAAAVRETLERTAIPDFKAGCAVNLERALRMGDRLGGHWITGHVDGTGILSRIQRDGVSRIFTVRADSSMIRYMVEKGSVALDGVSLTVFGVEKARFQVALIPHTLETTTLGLAREGCRMNIETDLLGKYVEKILSGGERAFSRDASRIRRRDWETQGDLT
ncbi:riboflavin synthase [bacterium]|nr:riboflavin synthase [bacterium]